MREITKLYRIETSHRLQNHPAACKNLHGHSYLFEITVRGELNESTGMILDFKDLKQNLSIIPGCWDHSTMLEKTDPLLAVLQTANLGLRIFVTPSAPTAEWMAQQVGETLNNRFGLNVTRVKVWETVTSFAEWIKREGM